MEIKNKHFQVIFTQAGIEVWTGRGYEYVLMTNSETEAGMWTLSLFTECEEREYEEISGTLPDLIEWINSNL